MKSRNCSLFILLGLTFIMLTGCSTLKALLPPTAQELAQQAHKREVNREARREENCKSADLLLSNLTKPIERRIYSVKPGEICHV